MAEVGGRTSYMVSFWLNNEEYRLTPSEAREVDEKDKSFPTTPEGDKQFNKWFKGFAKSKHIRPVNKQMSRWWTGTKVSTDPVVKMATTLRACRAVVQVVDPENKLNVQYKQEAMTSSWWGNRVDLPVFPVKEIEDMHECMNTMGGFAIHEADHSKHTRPLLVEQPEVESFLKQSPVNMTLSNLLEDIRDERIELEENPGFASYIKKVREFMWSRGERTFKPWDESDVEGKLNGIITGTMYPEREVLDTSWTPIIEKVNALVDEYCDDPIIIRNVNRLKELLEITPQDEQELKDKQREARDRGEEPGKNSLLPCEAVDAEAGVSLSTKKKVEGLVEEEVETADPFDPKWLPNGQEPPTITILRPKYRGGTLPKMDGHLAKAKAAIELRRAIPRADERLMASGELDEDELHRLYMGDMRVFRDITEEVVPASAIYLLVDMSGSMNMGYADYSARLLKMEAAQRFAALLVTAMKSKPNLTVRVLGHTGDKLEEYKDASDPFRGAATFYRLWEEGDNINRLSLITDLPAGNNYDSFAIAWAGELLSSETAEQKVMIVLSDGKPSGRGYGGEVGRQHVRRHVDALARKGIDVIQIAIDTELRPENQAEMYKHWVPADGTDIYSTALRHLQRILLKMSQPKG